MNNQFDLNLYNKKNKTNYTFIDNNIYFLLSENALHKTDKRENLPHLHILVGFNSFSHDFNKYLLHNDIYIFFKQKFNLNLDIKVDNLLLFTKSPQKKNDEIFFNIVNKFNYI